MGVEVMTPGLAWVNCGYGLTGSRTVRRVEEPDIALAEL